MLFETALVLKRKDKTKKTCRATSRAQQVLTGLNLHLW